MSIPKLVLYVKLTPDLMADLDRYVHTLSLETSRRESRTSAVEALLRASLASRAMPASQASLEKEVPRPLPTRGPTLTKTSVPSVEDDDAEERFRDAARMRGISVEQAKAEYHAYLKEKKEEASRITPKPAIRRGKDPDLND